MSRRGLPQTDLTTPAEAVVRFVEPRDGSAGATRPATARQRRKLTVQLPGDLVEELRDAVVYLPRQGVQATVAGLVEEALHHELSRLRDEYEIGERFPTREIEPRTGRPVGR